MAELKRDASARACTASSCSGRTQQRFFDVDAGSDRLHLSVGL